MGAHRAHGGQLHVRQKRNKVIIIPVQTRGKHSLLYHLLSKWRFSYIKEYLNKFNANSCKKIGILHMFYTILLYETKFFVFRERVYGLDVTILHC